VNAVPAPARLPTTQEHAVEWLRRAIVAGDLRPGERVNQEDVATRIGASVVPVREGLRVLEQEGQLTYIPRRGYFVTRLDIADLEEIYGLRQMIEERAAREALPLIDDDSLHRIERAAKECVDAIDAGDVAAQLAANRRFHFAILEAPGRVHTQKLIRVLWDSTEAYRALYYNSPEERQAAAEAHDRIVAALRARDADRLVAELDRHRDQALVVLRAILGDA
jgi:DNA-binding GntR family transcriptional regulator